MKVSPEYLIQLSHRVNKLYKEKEKFTGSPDKRTGKVYGEPK